MSEADTPTPRGFDDALQKFLSDKGYGEDRDGGNYRRNAERAVRMFGDYLANEYINPPETLGDLESIHFRGFARELSTPGFKWTDRAGNDEGEPDASLSASTVNTYFSMVSAWCGWCNNEGLIDGHYARQTHAREPLPDTGTTSADIRSQQSWTDSDRKAILSWVDQKVDEALDEYERSADALKELRDRAFVYTIAFSGVRGGEILRDPNDPRRDGLRWEDVNLDQEVIWVVPKKKNAKIDDRPLTPQAAKKLRSLHDVLEPEPEWPVFPTLDWRTCYKRIREAVADDARIDAEAIIDDIDGRGDLFDAMREYGVSPPSMNTNAGRQTMQRLCEALNESEDFVGEVAVGDDKHDYLAPHGGRRGVGKVLVEQRGYDRAAEQLDNSVDVVRESYSQYTAAERSQDVGAAFEEHDAETSESEDDDSTPVDQSENRGTEAGQD